MSGLGNGGLFAIDAGLRRWPGGRGGNSNSPRNGAGLVAACVRLPHGFLEERYARGLAVVYLAEHAGLAHASIACHDPNATIKGLARNWATSYLDDFDTIGVAPLGQRPQLTAVMGAQERGEFAYAIYTRSSGQFGGMAGTFGFSQHLVRFNQSSYAEARFHHPFSGEVTYSAGGTILVRKFPEAPFDLGNWNSSLHVSDTYPPRLWYLSDQHVFHWVDSDDADANPMPIMQRWGRHFDAAKPEPPPGPWRIRYQGAHFIQDYPVSSDTRGPVLVYPWGNDSTSPELWFFVQDNIGWRIYRAPWGAGNWRHPRSPFGVDPYNDGMAEIEDFGGGTYPQLNPQGLAFSHNWRQSANIVGRLAGIPRGLDLKAASIKVVRDARRINRLYMIATAGGVGYHAVSNNDGAMWSRFRRMTPTRSTGADLTGDARNVQGTVTPSGRVVVPATGRVQAGDVRSLLALNASSGGVTESDNRPAVYKRGETAGAVWH